MSKSELIEGSARTTATTYEVWYINRSRVWTRDTGEYDGQRQATVRAAEVREFSDSESIIVVECSRKIVN